MPRRSSVTRAAKRARVASPRGTRASKSGNGGKRIPAGIMRLSRVLREARDQTNLTQRAAAAAIGVHPVTLSTWESERRLEHPNPTNLRRLARAYGTTVAALQQRAGGTDEQASFTPAEPPRAGRGARHAVSPGASAPAAADTIGTTTAVRAATAATSHALAVRVGHGGEMAESLVLPRRAYGRIFRLLADLADHSELSLAELAGAQRALTDPALLGVFVGITSGPLSEEDTVAVIDAAAAAVRTFVTAPRG